MGIKSLYKDPTFIALCLGYAILSGIRKTLSVSLPLLMADLELSKSDVGVIASNFALAYGMSKFVGSVLSDYVSCRILFASSILLTSLCTMLFGFGSDLTFLCVVWFVNGCVQGLGWPALAAIIFDQYSQAARGTVWSAATAVYVTFLH
jgi:sugar phosphate permease